MEQLGHLCFLFDEGDLAELEPGRLMPRAGLLGLSSIMRGGYVKALFDLSPCLVSEAVVGGLSESPGFELLSTVPSWMTEPLKAPELVSGSSISIGSATMGMDGVMLLLEASFVIAATGASLGLLVSWCGERMRLLLKVCAGLALYSSLGWTGVGSLIRCSSARAAAPVSTGA